jgi:hypothetical protein
MGDCLLQLSEILGQAVDSRMQTSYPLTTKRHRGWVKGTFTGGQL